MKFYTIGNGTRLKNGKSTGIDTMFILKTKAESRKKALEIISNKFFSDSWEVKLDGKKYRVDGYGGVYNKDELKKLKKEFKEALASQKKVNNDDFYVGQIAIIENLKGNPLAKVIIQEGKDHADVVGDFLLGSGVIWEYYSPEGAKKLCKIISKALKGKV